MDSVATDDLRRSIVARSESAAKARHEEERCASCREANAAARSDQGFGLCLQLRHQLDMLYRLEKEAESLEALLSSKLDASVASLDLGDERGGDTATVLSDENKRVSPNEYKVPASRTGLFLGTHAERTAFEQRVAASASDETTLLATAQELRDLKRNLTQRALDHYSH
eukprot:CAMPEP_0185831634 /NCGR_PEP_ID=MMETSP1353-20130828/1611_1 /TAXON_ID=1077150 /ORGANISM="Erythrolobus australicus, Strain CCMP3124" /LENGTH=168 /DNA_ID=CAMNT_0028529717 /DNA_START=818 /DNA_END=1321 /DNA_ORIENTATION=+